MAIKTLGSGISYNRKEVESLTISDLHSIIKIAEEKLEYYRGELDFAMTGNHSEEDKQSLYDQCHYWDLVLDKVNDVLLSKINNIFREIHDEDK